MPTEPGRRALGATLAVAVVLGGVAAWHALGFMDTFNGPPAASVRWEGRSAELPTAAPSPRRVVLAVVDGLREDWVDALGFAADDGARCVLDAQLPTFSRPNYVALATGVPPSLSGVRTNDHEGPAQIESVFDVARAAGYRTEVVTDGTDWWGALFPSAWREARFLDKPAFASLMATYAPAPGSLTLVHIVDVDDQGHDHGVAAAYGEAAKRAGAVLRGLWGRLDRGRDTLFVTSDHGHIDRGGHGGPELEVVRTPLLVLGAGARGAPGERGCHRSSLDLAPTVAAALGIRPPAASVGSPIAAVLAPELTEAAVAPASPPSEVPDLRGVSALPLAVALALWLAAAGLLVRAARRRGRGEPPLWHFVVRGAAYVVAFAGIVLGSEPTVSLSAVWLRGPWIMHMAALTLAAAILAWALTWVLNASLRQRPARAAQWVLLFAALPFAVAAGAHGSFSGGPELGEPHAAFGLLLGDFCVLGGALSAVLLVAFEAIRRARGVAESLVPGGRPRRT
ncbi:MAG: hypothetical protein H6745_27705 [Deltaproteobacteria bacterium]|nr:hypothetical protein [Deltaproteobacteria bacterium]